MNLFRVVVAFDDGDEIDFYVTYDGDSAQATDEKVAPTLRRLVSFETVAIKQLRVETITVDDLGVRP